MNSPKKIDVNDRLPRDMQIVVAYDKNGRHALYRFYAPDFWFGVGGMYTLAEKFITHWEEPEKEITSIDSKQLNPKMTIPRLRF